MSAYTAAQLEEILGEYVQPGGKTFPEALRQVLPRVYQLGLWRDLAYETSISGRYGYLSLPPDTDTVLACTINDSPRPVRSMWHDIRIFGRSAMVSDFTGIVDDGYHPVMLDMADVREDATYPTQFDLRVPGSLTAVSTTGLFGGLTLTYEGEDGAEYVAVQTTSGDLSLECAEPCKRIKSITYESLVSPLSLVDTDFPTKVIAEIPAGSGVCRFRRFRTSRKADETMVHLFLKRAAPAYISDETVIHLGNLGAIKHGLLALIAEDNADYENAKTLWAECGRLLDEDLRSILGAAKPVLNVNFGPCPPLQNLV